MAHVLSYGAGTLPAMVAPLLHFSPHLAVPRPCWHCTSFGGMLYGGTAARCDRPGGTPVQAGPATGCAFWVREVGADDEPGPPVDVAALVPYFGTASAPSMRASFSHSMGKNMLQGNIIPASLASTRAVGQPTPSPRSTKGANAKGSTEGGCFPTR